MNNGMITIYPLILNKEFGLKFTDIWRIILCSVTFQDHGSPQLIPSGSKQFCTLTISLFSCLTSITTNSFDRFLDISLYASCFNYVFPVSCLGVLSNTFIFTLLCICGVSVTPFICKIFKEVNALFCHCCSLYDSALLRFPMMCHRNLSWFFVIAGNNFFVVPIVLLFFLSSFHIISRPTSLLLQVFICNEIVQHWLPCIRLDII